jgi:RNA polymerase sigma-70 factor (ECF subfamily)
MANSPDEALVAECLRGSEGAFDQLMERYQDSLFRLAYYWTGNREDAQDLCQDCFIHLFHVLCKYDPQYRFEIWLYKVCTNHSINWVKRHRRRPPAMSLSSLLGEEVEIPDAEVALPEKTLLDAEDRKAILDAVNALPAVYRMPIVLKYLEDFSYKEIAQTLDISVKNVEIRLHRAKAMLQKSLRGGFGRAKA